MSDRSNMTFYCWIKNIPLLIFYFINIIEQNALSLFSTAIDNYNLYFDYFAGSIFVCLICLNRIRFTFILVTFHDQSFRIVGNFALHFVSLA